MTREQVLNSNILKKKFCRDCRLPISVYDNPYFYQRLCAIDPVFNCIDKFEEFCNELKWHDSEQDYCKHYNDVKDAMINSIKSNEAYKAFNEKSFDFTPVFAKRNLYVEENDNGQFISIDMKKANFSALRHFSDEIFEGCETWEEYLLSFTSDLHMADSKYIRQVIMGACNPKKQIRYEHYLMNILLKHILKHIDGIDVFSLGEDEIIIKINRHNGYSINKLIEVINDCPDNIGDLVRVEMFSLHKIPGTDGWLKDYWGDREYIEFKCLEPDIYHQVVKYYFGEPITEFDLVFYHGNRLSRFLKEIDNPWSA